MLHQQVLFEQCRSCLPDRVTAFASGANEAREIRGFALVGIPVGFSVALVREEAMDELLRSSLPLFADSGAFSEIPITHAGWLQRLDRYLCLARVHGTRLSVVAPDRIGDQRETLRLVETYRSELARIALTGAHVLLPIQRGDRSADAFYAEARKLSDVAFVPALPMNKAAMSHGEALAFVRSVLPGRVHLLGMGYHKKAAKWLVRLLLDLDDKLVVTLDSNRLRAVTGGRRPLTKKERELRSVAPGTLHGEVDHEAIRVSHQTIDYTDMISLPSLWANATMLKEIALMSFDCPVNRDTFLDDPDAFLQLEEQGTKNWERAEVAYALDQAWERWVHDRIDGAVRTAAICHVFTGSQIAMHKTFP